MAENEYSQEIKETLKDFMLDVKEARKVKGMMNTEGWQVLEKFLIKEANKYNNLKHLNIKSDDSPEKIANRIIEFKATAIAYEKIINFAKYIVKLGDERKERIREIKEQLKNG